MEDKSPEERGAIRKAAEIARLTDKSTVISSIKGAQKIRVTSDFTKFLLPCRIIVAGNTNCGKTRLICQLIKYRQQLFAGEFHHIIYSIHKDNVGVNQDVLKQLTESVPGLSIQDEFRDAKDWDLIPNYKRSNFLIIIEDQGAYSPNKVRLKCSQIFICLFFDIITWQP
jgi:hypothetical protein